MTLGIFLAQVGVLSYQRFYSSKKLDDATYRHRIKVAAVSSLAGFAGGALGASIGCFLGNLFAPGIGGYVGSLIGGFLCSAGAAVATDYHFDLQSYQLESYEHLKVADQDKYRSYIIACETISVFPEASRAHIMEQTRQQYLRFHPDKHAMDSPQEKEYYEKKFIQVRIAYDFIKVYRQERGTWSDNQ